MEDLTQHLKNHPRMIGVLFTIMLALSQAGTAAAGASGSYAGT
ncbi:DUF7503 family protein [Natronorubrum halalkaliphilum]|nr:hypothetical protein [Natronorubrum halalkaliphilum]